jgi:alkanesulfonate monooxygenase SsuD/methylene tetrahydromethanopterin reductase-like flavin-dependent oxidoreductase (luciferase family)
MITAQVAWDLAAMSGGRFILGLGTQVKPHIVRRFAVPWTTATGRLRDYIDALRAIWTSFQTGESLRFDSEEYRFTLMTPFSTPDPSSIRKCRSPSPGSVRSCRGWRGNAVRRSTSIRFTPSSTSTKW